MLYKVGEIYETQEGKKLKIEGENIEYKGYETIYTIENGKKVHRYNRTTHNSDNGRVTGTNHDYSDPRNFKRLK